MFGAEAQLELAYGNADERSSSLMSDDAYFNLQFPAVRKNFRYWVTENPHTFGEHPLNIRKISIRYAVSRIVTIGHISSKMQMGRWPQLRRIAIVT
jgi:hypothetical protein